MSLRWSGVWSCCRRLGRVGRRYSFALQTAHTLDATEASGRVELRGYVPL